MAPKLVANFRRSLSFPNHPSHSSKPSKPFHVRSTSLPCGSHPLISQLKDDLAELKSWRSNPHKRTSAWLSDGLSRLKTVHDYLDDILQLPQTRELLQNQTDLIENLLEDFLQFVDVYGIFQNLILSLKQEHSAIQVALRKKDDSKIALYRKAWKKLSKEMGKLVSTIRLIGNSSVTLRGVDAELAEVITDVKEVTSFVSIALLNGISLPFVSQNSSWKGLRFPKKGNRVKVNEEIQEFQGVLTDSLWSLLRQTGDDELRWMVLKKMHDLEDCVVGIEICSERVFRGLLTTRVSLLNVLTH
ncbi:GRIP domain-containing protein [Actinidia chinensis var. chinensis]|uniref:GRIP domain-containing protein n=1 Tax=Actinidia chinensis var. chinensis TaxID=1590841 RepID=A0A2R6R3L5_ACTCC|nr:GRIP domain-containing protein [Actinidia chinensis var. chinensis]